VKTVSWLLTALLVLLLLAAAYLGLTGGFTLLREARSATQWAATGTELLYGLTALPALATLPSRRPWALRLLIVWAAAVTATSVLAPVVWGRTTWTAGAASGCAVGALLALLLWGWHHSRRFAGRPGASQQPASGGWTS
jgi:hypothetical protein